MKPNITIFTFTEGCDQLEDILGFLDGTFVRHYGAIETTTDYFVEFVGSSKKPFTKSQLRAAVTADFKQSKKYDWTDVSDKAVANFLKK